MKKQTELETYGSLAPTEGKSRGQDFTAYYLNEEQALLLCIFAETENAALVRKQVISTFMAYRRGQLVVVQQVQTPAIPDFSNPAEALCT